MQEDVLFKITNGLYIISSQHKDNNDIFAGSLIDAVTQVAINPNILIISCMNGSYTKECIEHFGKFGISILPQNIATSIIADFGFQTSRNKNKWQKINYSLHNNLPYISDCLGKIEAKVINTIKFSCNTMFIAEIIDAFDAKAGIPLTYANYRNNLKDNIIKEWQKSQSAPNKIQEKNIMENNSKEKKYWTCIVCGYVYDDEIPFEELPEDWVCPLCGVGKELFELR